MAREAGAGADPMVDGRTRDATHGSVGVGVSTGAATGRTKVKRPFLCLTPPVVVRVLEEKLHPSPSGVHHRRLLDISGTEDQPRGVIKVYPL